MQTLLTAVLILTLPPSKPEPPELARLDFCIQNRFQDRTSFGMKRILPRQDHGIRTFAPENPWEQTVVESLRSKGYEVALFLAGRNVLVSPPPQADARRYVLQGPAFITEVRDPLPNQDALLAESRTALKKGEAYDVRRGEWTVAFRPLRATSMQCVRCHASGLKVGDELGVAMYVYRQH